MSYIGNSPTTTAFVTDQFSGNGSTVAYTMSVAPATTSSVLVSVTGVLQDPSTYSVSGTTLTFSAAPPTGTGNISVRYLGIPASGVTTTAYRTVTEFTATSGQTTFTVPSYTAGFINVYRNGVLLGSSDYTATSGTTVVLASGAVAGDLVTTESFYVSSVLNAIPATAGAVNTGYISNGAVTPAKLSQPLTSGTAVASTSGTSIDFTGIPSWVKRITVMFNGVSINGTSTIIIQTGTSGGVTTSGYLSCASAIQGTAVGSATFTTGFGTSNGGANANTLSGIATVALQTGNTWVMSSSFCALNAPQSRNEFGAGSIALSGTLDRIRITTVNGTDTFDAGLINILYE